MSFDGRLLAGVGVLAAVVESGNFVRAADALALSPSGVSRAVARLEARVGIRLLQRTTRSVTLTDEGRRFYEQVLPLLSGIEEAARQAAGANEAVAGRLRVAVDAYFSQLSLAPRLGEFSERHPRLQIEVLTREEIGDLVAEGIDVAVRFGEPGNSSLIARQLLHTRILTVAAPAYLARHGRPTTPDQLAGHNCIQFRDPTSGRAFPWEFQRSGEVRAVGTAGPLLLNDVNSLLAACVAGAGIAQIMALGARSLLTTGQLVELFPDWSDETFPLYAFYPSRRLAPAKVRAFIDFCLEIVADAPAGKAVDKSVHKQLSAALSGPESA